MHYEIDVMHGNNSYYLRYECKIINIQDGFYALKEVNVFSASGKLAYTREEVYVPIALSIVEKI